VPAHVKGTIRVIGLLDGWPFPVAEEATEVVIK
jgi:hypothetical protein